MRPIGNPILCLQCRVRLAAGQINILVDKGKLRRLPSHVCVYTSYRLEWRSRGGTANAVTGHLSAGVSGKGFLEITFPFYGKGTGIKKCYGKGREGEI